MSTRVVGLVDDWTQQPLGGGYQGLQELADSNFSGACRAGGAELYMTNGTVVGVLDGTIDRFDGAEGTAHRAPSPALPLLAVMQERNPESRAQYYTEETPISEVDRRLSDGGFSGYVELSENVLSGDYYLVYHAGRSMSVAFVGGTGRLVDGEEAFQTVDDEVGIYGVHPVDIEPIEIPEPEPEPESGATVDADQESGVSPGADADSVDEEADTAPAGERSTGASDRDPPAAATASTGGAQTEADVPGQEAPTEPETSVEARAETADAGAGGTATEEQTASSPDQGNDAANPARTTTPGTEPEGKESSEDGPEGTAAEPAPTDTTLERRAIPSLDPDRTVSASTEGSAGQSDDRSDTESETDAASGPSSSGTPPAETGAGGELTGGTEPGTDARAGSEPGAGESSGRPAGGVDTERLERLERELADSEAEIERLESELVERNDRLERNEEKLESIRAERDDLAEEVEQLEAELERVRSEFGAATGTEQRLSAPEALDGTDVFVRYGSKGKATLEKAHGGGPRREKVQENLRLEEHTQFDVASTAVGGQAYDVFLEESLEFQFVEWLVRELLFEIRDTGHTDALSDLYDALPAIDRADINGAVDVTYTEDGQETRGAESFDVVFRDRMGDPLVVADLNDDREAASESMMERLITAAERVGQSNETLAGAFLVTESFFEPAALEMASEATRSGLLSRDRRASFVNLSRKRGYHLCLVEGRNRNFNLAVPDL